MALEMTTSTHIRVKGQTASQAQGGRVRGPLEPGRRLGPRLAHRELFAAAFADATVVDAAAAALVHDPQRRPLRRGHVAIAPAHQRNLDLLILGG